MKWLESAENLLKADHQNEAKSNKIATAIATHKSNISLLQEAISEAIGKCVGGV